MEGKSEEQKQKLATEFVKIAKEVLGYGDDAFSVAIQDYTKEEWKNDIYDREIMENKDILYKEPGYEM